MKTAIRPLLATLLLGAGLTAAPLAALAEPTPQLPQSVARAEGLGAMPAWSLKTTEGKVLSSSSLKGKILVIDFWATWCPPCRQEIPGFIELQRKYGGKGVQFLGFSLDKDEAAHVNYHKKEKMNYPSMNVQGADGQKVVTAFERVIGEIEGIPTTVLVDGQGRILQKKVGAAEKATIEAWITQALSARR